MPRLSELKRTVLSFARDAQKDTLLSEGFVPGNVSKAVGISRELAESVVDELTASKALKMNEIRMFDPDEGPILAYNYSITFRGLLRLAIKV